MGHHIPVYSSISQNINTHRLKSTVLFLAPQVASVLTLKVVALFVAKEPFNGLLVYKKIQIKVKVQTVF